MPVCIAKQSKYRIPELLSLGSFICKMAAVQSPKAGLSNLWPEGHMGPRSACNVAQCNFFIFKEIPKFQVTLPALAAGMWPGHVTTVGGERGKEGRSGRGGEKGPA